MGNNKILFYESITEETESMVDLFISVHTSFKISYWEWREFLGLMNRVYKELETSTLGFGKKIDEIIEPYKNKEISLFDEQEINKRLAEIAVVRNQNIHMKISTLNKYYY